MTSISTQINNSATYTAMHQAATDTVTGAASTNMTSSDFLNLMLKQLQYQDPMSPTDNAQFVSQQCQFAQLSATTDMSSSLASTQALSLVGKSVTLKDPDDKTKVVTGTVSSVTMKGNSSSLSVNGKKYPASSVISVNEVTTPTTGSTSTTPTTGNTNG